ARIRVHARPAPAQPRESWFLSERLPSLHFRDTDGLFHVQDRLKHINIGGCDLWPIGSGDPCRAPRSLTVHVLMHDECLQCGHDRIHGQGVEPDHTSSATVVKVLTHWRYVGTQNWHAAAECLLNRKAAATFTERSTDEGV